MLSASVTSSYAESRDFGLVRFRGGDISRDSMPDSAETSPSCLLLFDLLVRELMTRSRYLTPNSSIFPLAVVGTVELRAREPSHDEKRQKLSRFQASASHQLQVGGCAPTQLSVRVLSGFRRTAGAGGQEIHLQLNCLAPLPPSADPLLPNQPSPPFPPWAPGTWHPVICYPGRLYAGRLCLPAFSLRSPSSFFLSAQR